MTDHLINFAESYCVKKDQSPMQSSCEDLCARINSSAETYEFLKEDIRCMYFDIDCYATKIKKQDATILETKGLEYLQTYLRASGLNADKYAIATSHGNCVKKDGSISAKYSVRYWFPDIKAHRKTLETFVKELNKWIISTEKTDPDHLFMYIGELFETNDNLVFDEGIYDPNRKMRCLNTSKPRESRPLILKHGSVVDTIIQNTGVATQTIAGKSPEENGIKISSENEHIQKYCDYVSIISPRNFDEYLPWLKFTFASANLLIPFDVYDKFMKGCKGYDLEKNREIYERPLSDKKEKLGWKHIYDLAFASNPEKKVELDARWGKDLFCKYKFRSIYYKFNPNEEDEEKRIAQENEIHNEMIRYFEKYHFKVKKPFCIACKTENGFNFVSDTELHKIYHNLHFRFNAKTPHFTVMWLEDFNIREYESYDFCPPPMYISDFKFNLFNGFEHEKILPFQLTPDEIKDNSRIFIKHLWYLAGKNNDVLDYILNYLAHMVQEPGELPRTSILFKSEQGVGKNVFFEMFGEKILGQDYLLSTANIDHILGRFPMISQKILVLMDEVNGKDSFLANDKIKNFITARKFPYERKGIDPTDINNCARMLFFSNSETPIKIEQTDRRFVVSECSSDMKNNTVYFKALLAAFNNKKLIWSFAQFLMNRNIAEWDSVNDRPITNLYKQIQTQTVPTNTKFFLEYKFFRFDDAENQYTGKMLFDAYVMFCQSHPKNFTPITEMTFLKKLKDYEFLSKRKGRESNTYVIVKEDHSKFIISNQGGVEDVEETDDFEY
jgi:hypothetical protein